MHLADVVQLVRNHRGDAALLSTLLPRTGGDPAAPMVHQPQRRGAANCDQRGQQRRDPEQHRQRRGEQEQRLEEMEEDAGDPATQARGIVDHPRQQFAGFVRFMKRERLLEQLLEQHRPEAVRHAVSDAVEDESLGVFSEREQRREGDECNAQRDVPGRPGVGGPGNDAGVAMPAGQQVEQPLERPWTHDVQHDHRQA